MIWTFWRAGDRVEAGELARREHSRWLTRALRSGRAYPRIPVRRVDDGGYGFLARRTDGPARAQRWWSRALDRVD